MQICTEEQIVIKFDDHGEKKFVLSIVMPALKKATAHRRWKNAALHEKRQWLQLRRNNSPSCDNRGVHESRRRRFPGQQLRSRRLVRRIAQPSPTCGVHLARCSSLGDVDAVILPGGFSYGDYLRCGAIAKFSPVIQAIQKFAADGGLVLGICNGFQILVEAGLLAGSAGAQPGPSLRLPDSADPRRNHQFAFHSRREKGQMLNLPVAHGEGCYIADERTLDELEAEDRVAFRYLDNPEWLPARHRGHSQRAAQCPGHDAPSRARRRSADGLHRRPGGAGIRAGSVDALE